MQSLFKEMKMFLSRLWTREDIVKTAIAGLSDFLLYLLLATAHRNLLLCESNMKNSQGL